MHLHAARLASRQDASGGLLLLEEQDRSLWDAEHLRQGASWLARAAQGDVFTRFHAEAALPAEHCFAPSFADTRWNEMRAVCHAGTHRPITHPHAQPGGGCGGGAGAAGRPCGAGRHGAACLAACHYLWDAVLADLHHRAGNAATAERHREQALAAAPSTAVRKLLQRRLTKCERG